MACHESFRTNLVVRCPRPACGCEELTVEVSSQTLDVAILCPKCTARDGAPVVIEHMRLRQLPCGLNFEALQEVSKPTTH